MLSVFESWESRGGELRYHRNDIPVEVLGKEAQRAYDTLRPNDRVAIDGYLRSEVFKGKDKITVRVFNISYEGKYVQTRNGSGKGEGAPPHS